MNITSQVRSKIPCWMISSIITQLYMLKRDWFVSSSRLYLLHQLCYKYLRIIVYLYMCTYVVDKCQQEVCIVVTAGEYGMELFKRRERIHAEQFLYIRIIKLIQLKKKEFCSNNHNYKRFSVVERQWLQGSIKMRFLCGIQSAYYFCLIQSIGFPNQIV